MSKQCPYGYQDHTGRAWRCEGDNKHEGLHDSGEFQWSPGDHRTFLWPTVSPTKKLVDHQLSYSYTQKGVKQWWDRPRYQLEGLTPSQAWKNGKKVLVYRLAESDRAMEGT